MTLAFRVEQDGQYQVEMQLTEAGDYGIVQLYLDGEKLGDGPIDLYGERVVLTGPLDMGTHRLTKGEHHLMVQITGANEDAFRNYMAGLDYLRLRPVSSATGER